MISSDSILAALIAVIVICIFSAIFTCIMYIVGSTIYVNNYTGGGQETNHYSVFFIIGIVLMSIYGISSLILVVAPLIVMASKSFTSRVMWAVFIYGFLNLGFMIYLAVYTRSAVIVAFNNVFDKNILMQTISHQTSLFLGSFFVFNVVAIIIACIGIAYMRRPVVQEELIVSSTPQRRRVQFDSNVASNVDKRVGYTRLGSSEQVYTATRKPINLD